MYSLLWLRTEILNISYIPFWHLCLLTLRASGVQSLAFPSGQAKKKRPRHFSKEMLDLHPWDIPGQW